MALSKGNMYDFAVTWNPLAGDCLHNCTYCSKRAFMRYPAFKEKYTGEPRIDKRAMKENLYSKKYKDKMIFVCGVGNDLFAEDVFFYMIEEVLKKCNEYQNNTYFFQTKNPSKMAYCIDLFPRKSIFCITLETNRYIKSVMSNCVSPRSRFDGIIQLKELINNPIQITIEPIMDFDLSEFLDMIEICEPNQVNIGADSKRHNLPEPPKEKILTLITELEKFTKVKIKTNLKSLIK